MNLPTSDDPIEKRVVASLVLLVTLPLWWPPLFGFLILVWLLMGLVVGIVCLIALLMPLWALRGIDETGSEK